MGVLGWILFGLIVGIVAKLVMPGRDPGGFIITILLGIALGYAETVGAFDLFIGANILDYSGYPDCRPAFLDAFAKLANLATKVRWPIGKTIGVLLAGTIPLLGVIVEHFQTKQIKAAYNL